ncbi:uncharacterized protein LOC132029892 isoform X2 [Lycium ferocissimum]|uniref:uncharacterized protein LOC132029892 isoform X2 n=1 Tax=Lycium ferocissimum TaxID=112874 RepID=UPI0028160D37|nr:uncharacterized protein LOC132029892 isoform X2 [Lycium ferocissimum]XP_059275274.1 uncharacterized protein LOC132029892 isoform X2 [Lycium ferocissimum]
MGYDETNVGSKNNLDGMLGGDEPYYDSDEAPSFELDDETGWGDEEEVEQVVKKPLRRKVTKNRVVFDKSCKKVNIEAMKMLGEDGLHALMYYNIDRWCKRFFKEHSKVDSVDNNMAESFNNWILAARFKTIITMLEEIRVKMMRRIGELRQFSNTWITDISPMAFKILQENIDKSMKCSLSWNGERGFEVRDPWGCTHTVDIQRQTCSCRSRQLRGIPCAHAVAAIHHKRLHPIHFVASCYKKETYLSTYAHFVQPMNNMKMWPTSNNPRVEPPVIRQLPGRPPKSRRKEVYESRKTGLISKRGTVLTCSTCHAKGHNKRGCPIVPRQTTETADQIVEQAQARTNRGRANKRRIEQEAASCGRVNASGGATYQSQETQGTTSGHTSQPYKRPRIVGVGRLVADDGFTTLNHGMPSRRAPMRSDVVTGDIGYTPKTRIQVEGQTSHDK